MVFSRRTAVILAIVLMLIPSLASLSFAALGSEFAGLFQALTAFGATFGIATLCRSFGYSVGKAVIMTVLAVPCLLFLLIALSVWANCMVSGCYV
jgi:hypothetical protein